jgi:hypothetical protein
MALVPKQTKAETKLMWGLTFNRVFGLVGSMMLGLFFGSICHRSLKIPFALFCVGAFLFLGKKAPTNAKKKYWQGITGFFNYVFRRRRFYSLHSYEYTKTIKKEAERDELKIRTAQEAKDKKETAERAKRNGYIKKILAEERKLRYKSRKREEKKFEKLARKTEGKSKKEARRKSASSE